MYEELDVAIDTNKIVQLFECRTLLLLLLLLSIYCHYIVLL